MSSFAAIAATEGAFDAGHAGRVQDVAQHFQSDKRLQAKVLEKLQVGVTRVMEVCRESVENAWDYFVAADFNTRAAIDLRNANWVHMDNLRDEEVAAEDDRRDRQLAARMAAEGLRPSPAVFPHLVAAVADTTTTTTAAAAAPTPAIRLTSPSPPLTHPDSLTTNAQAALLADVSVAVDKEDAEEEGSGIAAAADAAAAVIPAVVAPTTEGPKRGRKRKMVEELKMELVPEDAPRGKRVRKATFTVEPSVPPPPITARTTARTTTTKPTTTTPPAPPSLIPPPSPPAKKTRRGRYIGAEESFIVSWLTTHKAHSTTPVFKPDWAQLTLDYNANFAGQTLDGDDEPRPERTKDSIYSNTHRIPAACAVLGARVRGRSGNGGCYGRGVKKEEGEGKTKGVRGAKKVERKKAATVVAATKWSKAAELVMAAIFGTESAKKGGKGGRK
ncbi:hypothetical protein MMC34_004921 [Xylographa carneopallida]|nr:hypothetical protein [Xylographa carneopallida]